MEGKFRYFYLRLALVISTPSVIFSPISVKAENPPQRSSQKEEASLISVRSEDLLKIPAEKLPQELRAELEQELRKDHPHKVLKGSGNTPFDYILMTVRGLINGTSITAGYIINMQIAPELAVVPGLLGGTMSASLQYFHAAKSHWLKHKSQPKTWYDIPGYFRVSETEKAGIVESFFVKEFTVGLFYLNSVQVLSGLLGIQPEMLSWRPSVSAALGLFSEGVWNYFIAHITEQVVEKYPAKSKMLWRLSKIAASAISVASTFASAMFLMQKDWAPWIPVGMGITGGIAFATCPRLISRLKSR